MICGSVLFFSNLETLRALWFYIGSAIVIPFYVECVEAS